MTALGEIFAEVDRRLAVGAIDGLESYERMPSGDPARFPALVAYDDGDDPTDSETGNTRLGLILSVEGYVEGKGGASTHDAMIELHAATVFALCDDGTLGGLVETIEIVGRRRVIVAKLSQKRRVGFAQDFEITFATKRGNPAVFA